MKTIVLKTGIMSIIFAIIFLLNGLPARSQHIIRFTDGTEQRVIIVYLSKDTIHYYKNTNPEIVYVETMDHVSGMVPYDPAQEKRDSIEAVRMKNLELCKYKNKVTTGAVLMGVGALATGVSALIFVTAENGWDQLGAGIIGIPGMVLGSISFLVGAGILIDGSTKISIYKKTHSSMSMDLKCTPAMTGFSMVYKF